MLYFGSFNLAPNSAPLISQWCTLLAWVSPEKNNWKKMDEGVFYIPDLGGNLADFLPLAHMTGWWIFFVMIRELELLAYIRIRDAEASPNVWKNLGYDRGLQERLERQTDRLLCFRFGSLTGRPLGPFQTSGFYKALSLTSGQVASSKATDSTL